MVKRTSSGKCQPYHSRNTHRESVDVLVECIEQSDGLDDHVVRTVDVELDLGTRVRVTKTELCLGQISIGHTLEQLLGMLSYTTDEFERSLTSVAGNTQFANDTGSQVPVLNTENDALLLTLGQVESEERLEVVVDDTFRNVERSLKSVESVLERAEGEKLDHLAESVDFIDRLLNGTGEGADLLDGSDLEDSASRSALEEDVGGCGRHGGVDIGSSKLRLS